MPRQEKVLQHMGIKSIAGLLMFPRVKRVLNIYFGPQEHTVKWNIQNVLLVALCFFFSSFP